MPSGQETEWVHSTPASPGHTWRNINRTAMEYKQNCNDKKPIQCFNAVDWATERESHL